MLVNYRLNADLEVTTLFLVGVVVEEVLKRDVVWMGRGTVNVEGIMLECHLHLVSLHQLLVHVIHSLNFLSSFFLVIGI